jgi:hypothetical protein
MAAELPRLANPEWERLRRNALVAAGVGLVVCALGAILNLGQFFRSYLVAYQFWLAAGMGCLVVLMLQYLTGGTWGFLLRRILEAGSRTLWLLVLLFLPLVVGLFLSGPDTGLYPWANADHNHASGELAPKFRYYLTIPFFLVRAAVYFVGWLALAYFLNRWSRERDELGSVRSPRQFQLLSAGGLVLYGFTITFASVDWVMSIEDHWYSTIYPVLFATGQVLTGFALAVAVLILLVSRAPLSDRVGPLVLRDLGSLLLTFVMLWAYMSFSQFLLIWTNNLPEEIPWYLRRLREGWGIIGVLLIVVHFALPFLLLLSRDVKQNPRFLAGVALAVLVMRFIDVFWWIEPAYLPYRRQPLFFVVDIAALVAIGGVWVWWFLSQLEQWPLLPLNDPDAPELAHHE